VDAVVAQVPDLAGTVAKFSLAGHTFGTDRKTTDEPSSS
jgi:hypothetical protein